MTFPTYPFDGWLIFIETPCLLWKKICFVPSHVTKSNNKPVFSWFYHSFMIKSGMVDPIALLTLPDFPIYGWLIFIQTIQNPAFGGILAVNIPSYIWLVLTSGGFLQRSPHFGREAQLVSCHPTSHFQLCDSPTAQQGPSARQSEIFQWTKEKHTCQQCQSRNLVDII